MAYVVIVYEIFYGYLLFSIGNIISTIQKEIIHKSSELNIKVYVDVAEQDVLDGGTVTLNMV